MVAFMLTTLLAPVTFLNKLLFVALIAWTLLLLLRTRAPKPRLVLPVFGMIGVFLYGFLLALSLPNDHGLATQFFLATLILLLIHFVEFFKINMDYAAEFCGKIMVIVTAIYWLLYLNPDIPYTPHIVLWFEGLSASATSQRDYLGEELIQTLALSTVAFLFVPWSLLVMRIQRCFSWMSFLWLTLLGLTIVVSGRRGTAGIALLFLAYAVFTRGSIITRVLLIGFFVIFLSVFLPWLVSNTAIFSSDDLSNAIKVGHFQSFVEQLGWADSIFGRGLGSFYFSKGHGALTPHTELTPVDLARYVGIPLAIVAYGLLLLPRLFRLPFHGERHLVMASFALYLINSITNPILINSYGMLVVLWYWAKYREIAYGEPAQHSQRLMGALSRRTLFQARGDLA